MIPGAPDRRVLLDDGAGLLIAYDPSGVQPVVTVDSPDGAVEFRGIAEIQAAAVALRSGAWMAETFATHPFRRRQVHA